MAFYMLERALEHVSATLAMTVAMEAFDKRWQLVGQLVVGNTESCPRRTRVVDIRPHL